ncbi:MAG: 2-amino-4-hydroxy-6-hydroxymethyldihydropteridine diphosphokinase [Firmicutes bacterium]|nr:2-amino-4-hydroxy-6-hydroxymethyldihydropteridine diphosphokinase [Bacillota bacterium]
MDKITIKNLEVFANHGVFPEENVLGQKFVITAVMHTDTRNAGRTDNLEQSIHYGEVSHFIKKHVESHTFMLIERVAETLAEALLLEYPLMEKIELEIAKPWAPVGLPLETVSVSICRGWHTAYIALGSNMGDTKGYLDMAVDRLNELDTCRVIKVADYIETEPYGGVEQDNFLNSALELRTLLTPEELLEQLHVIEREAHRERIVHWGPRTLDLDILLYDDIIFDSDVLHIPHVEMHKRSFVLDPMVQLAPYKRHPVLGETMLELREKLD